MKTIYLAGAFMLTTAFFACTKDPSESSDINQVDQPTAQKVTPTDSKGISTVTLGAKFETYYESDKKCLRPAGKCINGQRPKFDEQCFAYLAEFDLARESSPTAVAQLLTSNTDLAKAIFPDWNEEYLVGPKQLLLSGDYFLLKKNIQGTNRFFYVLTLETSDNLMVDYILANDKYAYIFSFEF